MVLGEIGWNPLKLKGKWPLLVSGLSYFSLDSGCSVSLCLDSFCLSSFRLLLSWFCQSYFCLAQNRWAPRKQDKWSAKEGQIGSAMARPFCYLGVARPTRWVLQSRGSPKPKCTNDGSAWACLFWDFLRSFSAVTSLERKKRTRERERERETEKEKFNKWEAKKGSGETTGDTQK